MNAILEAFLDAMVNDDGSGTTGDLMDKTWWTDLIGRIDTVIAFAGLSIEEDSTFYVSAASGSDVTGDGSLVRPWQTLEYAISNLKAFRVAPGNTCTLQIDNGEYTLLSPLTNMPESLKIIGANTFIRQVTSVQSSTSTTITLNMFDVSSIEVGDECAIEDASGGSAPRALNGTYEITDVDAVNSRITIAASMADPYPSGLVTATAHIFKTRILAVGTSGIAANRNITIQDLALIGNAAADTYGIIPDAARTTVVNVAIRNFGAGGLYCGQDATLVLDGVYLADMSYGIYCESGGQCQGTAVIIARMTIKAIVCRFFGSVNLSDVVAYNAGIGIECEYAGVVVANGIIIQNGSSAIVCQYAGMVQADAAALLDNSGQGIYADFGGFVSSQTSTITNNSYSQADARNNSTITVYGSIISGSSALYAENRAYINAVTANITGSVSPSLNTQGNGYAYIKG